MTDSTPDARPKPLSARDLSLWLQREQPLRLVDVREQQELALAPFPHPVIHLPLSASERWLPALPGLLGEDADLVVLCHAGVRSWQFGCWLLARDPHRTVWNLEGGIDAWSVDVDPNVPRY